MARTVNVDRRRLGRWLQNFTDRHGPVRDDLVDDHLVVRAEDGAEARIIIPFPPLSGPPGAGPVERLTDHVGRDRRVGALLVRRGGFAVGVFDGSRLIDSKTGSSYVQSRTKAGGWSQQRYARRRDNQAQQLYDRAEAAAEAVLLPAADSLVGLATGGDRAGVTAVLETPRLARLAGIVLPTFHPTPDPRLRVLQELPEQFLAVRIELNDLA
jgi:hypothetical protein